MLEMVLSFQGEVRSKKHLRRRAVIGSPHSSTFRSYTALTLSNKVGFLLVFIKLPTILKPDVRKESEAARRRGGHKSRAFSW